MANNSLAQLFGSSRDGTLRPADLWIEGYSAWDAAGGCLPHRWQLPSNLLVHLVGTGMDVPGGEHSQRGHALALQRMSPLPNRGTSPSKPT